MKISIEKLPLMKGKELIEAADKLGIRVACNKERTALKEKKTAVIERITAEIEKIKAQVEEAEKAAKAKEEAEKKAPKKKERKIYEFNGKAQTMSAWAKELNMPLYVLWDRIVYYNWPLEKALTTPLQKRKKRKTK